MSNYLSLIYLIKFAETHCPCVECYILYSSISLLPRPHSQINRRADKNEKMNNNATLYAGMALILNTLYNITNNNTMPGHARDEELKDIEYLRGYINNKMHNETKVAEDNKINKIKMDKCEEDLYEKSEKFTTVMDSITRGDKEGCILRQLVVKKYISAVEELLNNSADVNGNCNGSSILHAAAATNDETLIQMMLDKGADVNKMDSNELIPVQLAAFGGYDKAVTMLVGKSTATRHGESNDKLPHLAARAGHVSVLKALHDLFPIKMVKEMNKWKETPLLVAASSGHLEAVKALIVMGADLKHTDKNGNTALHKAIDGKHNDTVDYLLSLKQFDVNTPNKKGNTPFHVALLRGQKDLVHKLIYNGSGADIWSEGADGQTALHFAAYSNMKVYLEAFLSAGMDINKLTKQKETPLHVAVRQNSKEAAIALINWAGVDLNAKSKSGETPLHFAAISNAKEIAEKLLEKGAKHLEENNTKKTPFDLSIFHKNFEIALILKEAEIY